MRAGAGLGMSKRWRQCDRRRGEDFIAARKLWYATERDNRRTGNISRMFTDDGGLMIPGDRAEREENVANVRPV